MANQNNNKGGQQQDVNPVSYTHLDALSYAYDTCGEIATVNTDGLRVRETADTNSKALEAVSYTHLDVHKRQKQGKVFLLWTMTK